jgi:hypothetical protein
MERRGSSALAIPVLIAGILFCVTPSAQAQVIQKVSAGGADIVLVPPGGDANFSLNAVKLANGTVKGQYEDVLKGGLQPGIHARVTCLSVRGNQAWVSGVITHTPPGQEAFIGSGVATRLEDNGTSADEPTDRLSFTFYPMSPDICNFQPDFPLFDVNNGQIKIESFE